MLVYFICNLFGLWVFLKFIVVMLLGELVYEGLGKVGKL